MTHKSRWLVKGLLGVFAGLAIVLVSATPAAALENRYKTTLAGTNYDNYIQVLARTDGTWSDDLAPEAYLSFGPSSTTATGCKITLWLELSDYNSIWTSARRTPDCTAALRKNWGYRYLGYPTGTNAAWVRTVFCVDLYYNNSPYTGWHKCGYSNIAFR